MIKWYKGGKFEIDGKFVDVNVDEIVLDSNVQPIVRYCRYIDDENIDPRFKDFQASIAKVIFSNKKIFVVVDLLKFIKGGVEYKFIKLEGHWPWFFAEDFKISEEN